ncbi:MAG: hypothetical protein NPINA01_20770 [Nitrospinaceae bacterium]|nr:MAG: hypothetical protein NPINA01_20770 [Nitrospinaceae bacterium]
MSEEKQPTPDPESPIENIAEESPQAAEPVEKEIDLNSIFPDAETDLNALFPDEEIKHLLKKVSKNKKDLHALKDRFLEENETEDDAKEESDNQENDGAGQLPT